MDGGAWWAAVYGVAQSWTPLKRLSSSSSKAGKISFYLLPTLRPSAPQDSAWEFCCSVWSPLGSALRSTELWLAMLQVLNPPSSFDAAAAGHLLGVQGRLPTGEGPDPPSTGCLGFCTAWQPPSKEEAPLVPESRHWAYSKASLGSSITSLLCSVYSFVLFLFHI